jgi:hypothetical protein
MSTEEFPKGHIEKLWAPWRVEYFEKDPRDMEFLSAAARASDDAEHLVVTRTKSSIFGTWLCTRRHCCGQQHAPKDSTLV